jgi:signal transduction histidine kinase/CheY-like chemotaxis protein
MGSFPEMKLHPLTLSFTGNDKHLEQIFLEQYRDRASVYAFRSLCLGLILYSLFAVLDAFLIPEKKYVIWLIRFAVVCPVLLVFILTSFFPFFKKAAPVYIVVALLLSGSGISFMVALAPPPASSSYYAGVILVFMLGYGFSRLRFIWATMAGWINVLVYEVIAIFAVQTSFPVLINNNFFFISANIIGMLTSYALESYTRRDFYLSLQLKTEQENVGRLNRNLEQKVLERTVEIREINKSLQKEIQYRIDSEKKREKLQDELAQAQKLEAIGQLAGGIAHDFNNQLTGILGNAEMLAYSLKDEKLKRFAENICKGALNGSKLTNQLLSFARKGKYQPVLLEINEVLDQVIGLLKHTIDKEILLVHNRINEKATILGDRYQIENAFLNIALNARDAITGNGKIIFESSILRINEHQGENTFDLNPGVYILTSIIDDGCGMSDEVKFNIFEPFFTTKEIGKGTGMGLPAAYGTVKHHGGGVFVESIENAGSSFHVLLPYVYQQSTIQKEDKQIIKAGKKENILIIDDDEIIQRLTKEFLEGLGYSVVIAKDGEEGLLKFEQLGEGVDLVVLDLVMPRKGGEYLFQVMKEIAPHLKILLVSGVGPEDDRVSRMIDKGVSFLEKPFSLIEFSGVIAGILQR